MMLSLTTGPATSAFKPAPTIRPIPARASGASWPKKAPRARPAPRVPPAPPAPRVHKDHKDPLEQPGRPAPPEPQDQRELAAQRTPIRRTEALNTKFKN